MPLVLASCAQKTTSHPPVGGFLSEKDLNTSKNRSKILNETERTQILDWISQQNEKFYPMHLNYWVNIENLPSSTRKKDGETVSFSYEVFDFDWVKLYDQPIVKKDVPLGKFEEVKAVEDVVRYLPKNTEAILLVPSVLAFGTYGDQGKISNDMPIIIKIKTL